MGIMVSKDLEQKSELNRRISSDLRTRAQSVEKLVEPDYDDDVEDTKKTGRFTWIWFVLIVLAAISLFCILFI